MTNRKILVVDDEEFNLEILETYLEAAGYEVETAVDGIEAWDILQKNPHGYQTVLLDRMMPKMDGLELLRLIKSDQQLNVLPVIMQTAMAASSQIIEGIKAGAYYYLTKPFDQETMMAVVNTAVSDFERYISLVDMTRKSQVAIGLIKEATFHIRTLDDCIDLAKLLATMVPDDEKAVIGISELLINAVEHGNLEITYEDKSRLLAEGRWEEEVRYRLELPQYLDRQAIVHYKQIEDGIEFRIKDCGNGFDWRNYMEYNPVRALDVHGRGILMAKEVTFGNLNYLGDGSEVVAKITHPEPESENIQPKKDELAFV